MLKWIQYSALAMGVIILTLMLWHEDKAKKYDEAFQHEPIEVVGTNKEDDETYNNPLYNVKNFGGYIYNFKEAQGRGLLTGATISGVEAYRNKEGKPICKLWLEGGGSIEITTTEEKAE